MASNLQGVFAKKLDWGVEPMTGSKTSVEKRGHTREMERVQNKLEQFLSVNEARETAKQIYDLAIEVDEEIDRILKDPLVARLYEYDGLFFTPRGTTLFHRAFNGIHVLRSLSDSKIDTFFYGRNKKFALKWMMEHLGTHTWEAKIRRMNWEESSTLSILTPEVIAAIIEDVRYRRSLVKAEPRPLSPEERAFFKSFEDQMRIPDSTGLMASSR